MARGSQFLSLITSVRAELRRSTNPAIGVEDLDSIKQTINRVYYTLYMEFDWPHLRKVFDRVDLADGQQYYDFPTGLNSERVERCALWDNGTPTLIERGISFEEYAGYDSVGGETSDPAMRWDIRWTGIKDQIEIWPVPVSNQQQLEFIGIQNCPPLVNDIDKCLLDDHLVILFVVAELAAAQKSADAQLKLSAAQQYLATLKNRSQGGRKRFTNGGGSIDGDSVRNGRAIVRVRSS